jgi:hypothetical protein
MENAFTLAVLIVAVVCVMIATRPTRPAKRRRQTPRDPGEPPGPPGGFVPLHDGRPGPAPSAPTTGRPRPTGTLGRLGRWDRRDLARTFTIDLVAPGSDAEVWPLTPDA